jgi:hypothetical protein
VPFDIPYECENLLVPVCASASAVAQCTIRLEPTWMNLGEVSGIAAVLSLKNNSSVQNINVAVLQKRIKAVGIPMDALE